MDAGEGACEERRLARNALVGVSTPPQGEPEPGLQSILGLPSRNDSGAPPRRTGQPGRRRRGAHPDRAPTGAFASR